MAILWGVLNTFIVVQRMQVGPRLDVIRDDNIPAFRSTARIYIGPRGELEEGASGTAGAAASIPACSHQCQYVATIVLLQRDDCSVNKPDANLTNSAWTLGGVGKYPTSFPPLQPRLDDTSFDVLLPVLCRNRVIRTLVITAVATSNLLQGLFRGCEQLLYHAYANCL